MIKKVSLLVSGILLLVLFTSCPNPVGPGAPKPPAPPAPPTVVTYKVAFDTDGGTGAPLTQTIISGEKATMPEVVPTKEGFIFLYWMNSEGNEFEFLLTPITSSITLTAFYVDSTVTLYTLDVTIDPENAGNVSPERRLYEAGEVVTLTAVANPGFRFLNWDDDETKTDTAIDITFDESNITVTAHFEEAPYTITASIPHATVTLSPPHGWYNTGEVVTVSITPNEGYQFLGWTGALSGKEKTKTITVGTEDIVFGAEIVERWLILVHFALDNDIDYNFETNYGIISHYTAALETVEAGDTDDVMDILVLMDGYTASDPRGNGYKTPFTDGYYKLTGENFADDLVAGTGEINSGSIQTSKDFIDWAYTNNKGKRVMYSVFNHGSGFDDPNENATYGIGFDDSNNGDSLSHKELAQVTSHIKGKAGKKIDLFFPYACLMGGIELAWEVKDNADYLLSSEEVFPAELWSYEALSAITADPQITGEKLGKAICDHAYTFFSNPDIDRSLTLSLVDLSNLDPLYNALNAFAVQMTSWIGSDVAKARVLDYAAWTGLYMSTPYYADIGVFMAKVDSLLDETESLTNPVRSALDSAVVYKKNFNPSSPSYAPLKVSYTNACGLTIFHNIWDAQYFGYVYKPSVYRSILTFGQNNAWGSYTQKLYALTPPPPETGTAKDSYEPDGLENPVNNILSIGTSAKQHHTFHEYTGDYDIMKVVLEKDKTYTFMTEAGTTGSDTYVYLCTLSGNTYNVIDANDDINYPDNPYSNITYTVPSSGDYYLIIFDKYLEYGDYNVYYDEGTFGTDLGPSFYKWSPLEVDSKILFN